MRYMKPWQLLDDLVKTSHKERGRLIGLDVGDKYVGLSLSDFDYQTVSPFRKKTNIKAMASDFQSLISNYSLKGFVIGVPFEKHRQSCDAAQVKVFIDQLCKTEMLKGLKYTCWNERFTSKVMETQLKCLRLKAPVLSKTMIDKSAAAVILQDYLDRTNRKMKRTAKE